jgi:dolichyl-phosphate-mannose--protein O-mannosyl transferase
MLTESVTCQSGYIFEDMNNDWEVEIVDSDPLSRTALKALRSKFRLRHVVTGCYLISKNLKLPKWGFGQKEVGYFILQLVVIGPELPTSSSGGVFEVS